MLKRQRLSCTVNILNLRNFTLKVVTTSTSKSLFLCFVDSLSRYDHVQEKQNDGQIILSVHTSYTCVSVKHINFCSRQHVSTLIITIIYLFTAIGLLPGGSGYFTRKQNMKLVTTKFQSGGPHEKHVVATWNVGNHLSICL